MENKYTSDELFHLVGYKNPKDHEANYETLGKVLRSGCVSHAPHHNDWGVIGYTEILDGIGLLEKVELISPTMTCYADIPFESLKTHTQKYGLFGVSFPLSLMIQYGARPVTYIPMRSDDWQGIYGTALLRNIEAVTTGFNEHVKEKESSRGDNSRSLGTVPPTTEEAIAAMDIVYKKDFLAFIKAFNSELLVDHQDHFYMEREWRKLGNMKFTAEPIERVVVVKGYATRVANDFPAYKGRISEIEMAA